MNAHRFRCLGGFVVLFVMFSATLHAVAQDHSRIRSASNIEQELMPLTPYKVDIYDIAEEDWITELSTDRVALTATFCIHPHLNRVLVEQYVSGGFTTFSYRLWEYSLGNQCKYTTYKEVAAFGRQGSVEIEPGGSRENFVGPDRHQVVKREIVFVRVKVFFPEEYRPERWLYVAIGSNRIEEDIDWPGL